MDWGVIGDVVKNSAESEIVGELIERTRGVNVTRIDERIEDLRSSID
jgi:hypothetical protein